MFSSSNLGTGTRGGNRHCGTYQQVGVVSQVHGDASPHQMVAMLFDGIFESLAHARAAMAAGEIETKGLAIGRVLRIVDEGLRGALDLQQGGTLARDLHDLYGYITARLSVANLKNDPAALDECAALLSPLREAWSGIRADVEPARAT
jgi:flagellar protein FliS